MLRRKATYLQWYLFVSPMVAGFLVFGVFTIGFLLYMSVHDWDFITPARFAGLDNFLSLLSDERFHRSVINTLAFWALFILPNAAISLMLALLVNNGGRFSAAFRSLYFVPVITSITVVALIWQWLLKPNADGPVNYIIGLVGLPPLGWLSSVRLALPSVVVVTLWTTVGYYMIIWLAGLQQLPREMLEAAVLDGANDAQVLWFVKLPLLEPFWFFILMQSTIGCLQIFNQVYLLTGGGPANATKTIVHNLWSEAFIFKHVGYASAISVVLLAATLSISLVMRRSFERQMSY